MVEVVYAYVSLVIEKMPEIIVCTNVYVKSVSDGPKG